MTTTPTTPEVTEDPRRFVSVAQYAEARTRTCESETDWHKAGWDIVREIERRALHVAPPPPPAPDDDDAMMAEFRQRDHERILDARRARQDAAYERHVIAEAEAEDGALTHAQLAQSLQEHITVMSQAQDYPIQPSQWIAISDRHLSNAKALGLIPAPPPFVVTDALVEACRDKAMRTYNEHVSTSAIRLILNHAAKWNGATDDR